jgi:DNA adenine methylase
MAAAPRIDANHALAPFLKWPGGKTLELASIAAAAPALESRFIDPFVGGGSVLLAVPAEVPALANDACRDLVELYTSAASGSAALRTALGGLAEAWNEMAELDSAYQDLALAESGAPHGIDIAIARQVDAVRRLLARTAPGLATPFALRAAAEIRAKFGRIRRLEARRGSLSGEDLLANVEGAVRASLYLAVRRRYNVARLADRWDATRAADFLFLREYAYAAMFRFNRRDEFNVPYGGISYNRKSLSDKARLLFSQPMLERLASTEFHSQDFEPFLAACEPARDDFVFVDPPYDSDFSAYDNRSFEAADQVRLARVLSSSPARVMVVIKDAPGDPGALLRRSLAGGRSAQDLYVDDQVPQRPRRDPPDDHELPARRHELSRAGRAGLGREQSRATPRRPGVPRRGQRRGRRYPRSSSRR